MSVRFSLVLCGSTLILSRFYSLSPVVMCKACVGSILHLR